MKSRRPLSGWTCSNGGAHLRRWLGILYPAPVSAPIVRKSGAMQTEPWIPGTAATALSNASDSLAEAVIVTGAPRPWAKLRSKTC